MTQLFGLGNAIVDVEVDVEDAFLTAQNLPKGQMDQFLKNHKLPKWKHK